MIDWLIETQERCPPAETFLGPAELERLAGMRVARRREDWLLGRWTAKRLLAAWLARDGAAPPALADLAIVSDPDGAPRAELRGAALGAPGLLPQISISHAGGWAFCAASAPGALLGADIERVAPRGEQFAEDYFTPAELALLRAAPLADRDALVTAIWSAKEAALKLTRHGLRADTRAVTCLPGGHTARRWRPVAVETSLCPAPLAGWWRLADGFVLTIVAGPL